MTETTDERIERVARAIFRASPIVTLDWPERDEQTREDFRCYARAADAISFAAGWDAAEKALRTEYRPYAQYGEDSKRLWANYAANYLAAHKPGEPT